MRIIQITAAYKPAYIYGGPTMSVAKLCEELTEVKVEVKVEVENKTEIKNKIEVLTTTANGTAELPVAIGLPQLVDGVKVTYFKRLTKDHTHFSPALLSALGKKLRKAKNKVEIKDKVEQSTNQQRATFNVQRSTCNNPSSIYMLGGI